MHIFAISGLHIALIAGMIVALLKVFFSRHVCGAVVLPLIWLYTAATGWQPSAVRAAIMSTVVLGGWMFARPGNLVNSLAVAALLILMWDPQQLFQASFQLSFLAVLSMTLIIPRLEGWRDRRVHHDPMLPEDAIPRSRQRALNSFRWGSTYVFTSLGAWLGTIPLTAWYFNLFSPVSLLANLLAVPASSAALACNMGSLACAGWWPWLAENLNHSAWFWMQCMLWVSNWAAETPWGWMHVPRPSLAMFIGYYGLLAGWFFCHELSGKWQRAIRFLLVAGFAMCAWEFAQSNFEARVTILPVSGGTSILAQPGRGGRSLLVDCGRSNAVTSIIGPVLRGRGINRLPQFVLSHGDVQNVGGALDLCAEFHPRETWMSGQRFRSPIYRLVTASLETNAVAIKKLARGDEADGWRVLHPEASATYARADDGTLCLARSFNGMRVLLLSDLGTEGQKSLAGSGQDLHADLVIAALPAEGEPLREELLAAIQPRGIIISDSLFPATERASKRLRERLSRPGLQVWYGSDHGALEATFSSTAWQVVNARGIPVEPYRLAE